MSQDFSLAAQIMQSLSDMKKADHIGILPRNSLMAERFYLAIDRAAQRVGEHIVRGVEVPLNMQPSEKGATQGKSRKEREIANAGTAYKDGLHSVSIQERACLLAMYNRLRAVSRSDKLANQTRVDFWQKDFDHASMDKAFLAGCTTHYLNIYTSTFNYPDDNADISKNAEVKDNQHLDLDNGPSKNSE